MTPIPITPHASTIAFHVALISGFGLVGAAILIWALLISRRP